MNNQVLIEARQLTFSYSSVTLLNGVNLSLRHACLAALIGANGSGKTTLIRLLCGLLHPVQGTIRLEGAGIDSLPRSQLARRVAYVPQSVPIVFPFTTLEVVLTGRQPHLGHFGIEQSEDLRIARDALEQVDVAHLAMRPVTALSAGERQLVFVARAIAQTPKLLLLDEPAGFLDLKHRAQLVQALRRLRDQRGITSLVVTHDLTFLEPSFDEVFALKAGQVAAQGSPSQVLRAQTLKEIYSVAIHTLHEEGKIFVWSEI